jgi:hypothetical protein
MKQKNILDLNYFKNRSTENELWCWDWKLYINKNWYSQISINIWFWKKTYIVSRLSAYIFLWLDINDSTVCVCHKCDNPKCINPDHLFLWTQKDNVKDMINKWRKSKDIEHLYWNNHRWKSVSINWLQFKSYTEAWKYFWITWNWVRKRFKWKIKPI